MKLNSLAAFGAAALVASSAFAQPAGRTMLANTTVTVTPVERLISKNMHTGDHVRFMTVGDVAENGTVIIPRGSPVEGTITFVTGRAVGGKSGKFEVTFNSVQVGSNVYALHGTHRQEGRGATAAALLGSWLISGRSARMDPGQTATAFTTAAIPY